MAQISMVRIPGYVMASATAQVMAATGTKPVAVIQSAILKISFNDIPHLHFLRTTGEQTAAGHGAESEVDNAACKSQHEYPLEKPIRSH